MVYLLLEFTLPSILSYFGKLRTVSLSNCIKVVEE